MMMISTPQDLIHRAWRCWIALSVNNCDDNVVIPGSWDVAASLEGVGADEDPRRIDFETVPESN
jgi:hypothetical protein